MSRRQRCAYFLCQSTTSETSMFRFPTSHPKRLAIWIENCGNMSIAHLSPDMIRNKYICIKHFEAKYITNKNGKRKRLSKLAVPVHYKVEYYLEPEILQKSQLTSTHKEFSDESATDLVVNKPAKVYKRPVPGTETDRGRILVFDLGPCEDCGQPIKRFQWWCIQCGGARCRACAQRMAHNGHIVLRAPAGGADEKTRAVIEYIRQQLQIEIVQVKTEIEDEETEETEDNQAEDDDRLTLDVTPEPEPEIYIEPTSQEWDPLSMKPAPGKKRRGFAPGTRPKRDVVQRIDYRPPEPDDRQLLKYQFNCDLPSPDLTEMDDLFGGFWVQDQRSPSHNQQDFTDAEHYYNTTHDYDNPIHTHSDHNTDSVKQTNDSNRIETSKILLSSNESVQTIDIKPIDRIIQSNIQLFKLSEIKRSTSTVNSNDNRVQESNIQVSSLEDQNTDTVKQNHNPIGANVKDSYVNSGSEKTVKQIKKRYKHQII